MLHFTRLFLAGPDRFQKLLLGNCVICLDVIGSDARARSDELIDDTIRYGAPRNCLCKINDRLTKLRRPLLKIIRSLWNRLLANDRRSLLVPECSLKTVVLAFRLRHSFVIRASSLVLIPSSFVISASSFLSCSEKENSGQHRVHHQHCQQCLDHRSRCCLANTLCAAFDSQACVTRDCDDEPCEDNAFDHS